MVAVMLAPSYTYCVALGCGQHLDPGQVGDKSVASLSAILLRGRLFNEGTTLKLLLTLELRSLSEAGDNRNVTASSFCRSMCTHA